MMVFFFGGGAATGDLPPEPTPIDPGFVYGDLNNDGLVNSMDMAILKRILLNENFPI